jgi:flagellar hook-length control protein FliK
MTMTTDRIAAPPPPAGAPPGKRAEEVQGDPFVALLDRHQARTASAEGDRRGPDAASQDHHQDRPGVARQGEGAQGAPRGGDGRQAQAADGATTAEAVADAAQALAATATSAEQPGQGAAQAGQGAAQAAQPAAGRPTGPQPIDPQPNGTQPDGTGPGQAAPAPVQGQPAAGQGGQAPALPAQGPAQPAAGAQPAGAQPPAGEQAGQEAAQAAGEPDVPSTPSSQAPAERAAAAQAQRRAEAAERALVQPPADGRAQAGEGEGARAEQPRPQAAVPPRPSTATAGNQGGQAQANGQSVGQPAAPLATGELQQPAAASGRQPVRAARLDQAVESVQALIRIAVSRGIGHARIALSPAELGGLEIRLRSSAAGVVASVVADNAQAAHQLQQAADDLRRALEAQGIDLLRLDIGLAADHRASEGAGTAWGGAERDRSAPDAAGDGAGGGPGGDGAAVTAELSVIQLPNGVLVDVLA